ncbi:NUDIX hydrolase [Mangrovimonas aestuarii]|uniref:NUDIX hydrolase n=1 Tax=Mangrovimonas aestuarii TaxID=3018443 RepID=UPI002378BD0E|nr:NUDIX domain-containing protein [Mangrovimonas aestuarii]
MEDEYIDILNPDGTPTGKSTLKSEAHLKGLYHNTAHVWFYTKDKQILLAQRAASKSICPLLWDVSVAGHVDAGESVIDAALRETREELGHTITQNDLQFIGAYDCFQSYPNGIQDNEFHHTFISELKADIETLNFSKEEVEALKLVSVDEFKNLLKHSVSNSHFISSNLPYYNIVLDNIQKAF